MVLGARQACVQRSVTLLVQCSSCEAKFFSRWFIKAELAVLQVLQLVRFPTMSQAELCQVGDHPLVAGDPKVQVRALSHSLMPPCSAYASTW